MSPEENKEATPCLRGQGAGSRRRPSADPRPPRPAPASCPPPPQQRPGDPDARASGGGSWRSSLLPRRQGALGFGASALPGGRTAGPCAAPPRTPKENETAARWRRPRQGRGREGRAEPHVRRRQRTQVLVGRPSCRPPLPPRTIRKNPRCTEGRAGTPGCSRVQAQPPATPHRCGLTF